MYQKPSQIFDCPCCPCLSPLQFYHFIFELEQLEVHSVFKLCMPQGFITIRWWQSNVSLLFCFILLSLKSLTFNFLFSSFFFFFFYWMTVLPPCFHRAQNLCFWVVTIHALMIHLGGSWYMQNWDFSPMYLVLHTSMVISISIYLVIQYWEILLHLFYSWLSILLP